MPPVLVIVVVISDFKNEVEWQIKARWVFVIPPWLVLICTKIVVNVNLHVVMYRRKYSPCRVSVWPTPGLACNENLFESIKSITIYWCISEWNRDTRVNGYTLICLAVSADSLISRLSVSSSATESIPKSTNIQLLQWKRIVHEYLYNYATNNLKSKHFTTWIFVSGITHVSFCISSIFMFHMSIPWLTAKTHTWYS